MSVCLLVCLSVCMYVLLSVVLSVVLLSFCIRLQVCPSVCLCKCPYVSVLSFRLTVFVWLAVRLSQHLLGLTAVGLWLMLSICLCASASVPLSVCHHACRRACSHVEYVGWRPDDVENDPPTYAEAKKHVDANISFPRCLSVLD